MKERGHALQRTMFPTGRGARNKQRDWASQLRDMATSGAPAPPHVPGWPGYSLSPRPGDGLSCNRFSTSPQPAPTYQRRWPPELGISQDPHKSMACIYTNPGPGRRRDSRSQANLRLLLPTHNVSGVSYSKCLFSGSGWRRGGAVSGVCEQGGLDVMTTHRQASSIMQ